MVDIMENFRRKIMTLPPLSKKYFVTKVVYYKKRTQGWKGPYVDKAYYYTENASNMLALLKNGVWGIPAPAYDEISDNETIVYVSPKKGAWIAKKIKIGGTLLDKDGNAKDVNIDVIDEQISMWRHMAEVKGLSIYQPEQNKFMQVLPIITLVGLGLSLYFLAMGAEIIFGGINAATYSIAANEVKNSMGTFEELVAQNGEEIRLLRILIGEKGYPVDPPPHPLDEEVS